MHLKLLAAQHWSFCSVFDVLRNHAKPRKDVEKYICDKDSQ